MSSLVESKEDYERVVYMPIPAVQISSTNSASPNTLFIFPDPNMTKARLVNLYIVNSDTVAHTVFVGVYLPSTSQFITYMPIIIGASSQTAFSEGQIPIFYGEGNAAVLSAYTTSAPSAGTFIMISGGVRMYE